MEIRKLHGEEYAAAMALVRRVFDTFVGAEYTPSGRETFYGFLDTVRIAGETTPDAYKLWGAFSDGTLAGMLACNPACDHINLLFVDEQYHRQGIAATLFSAMVEETRALGATAITVNASRHGLPAYRKLGFWQTGPETLRDGIYFIPMTHYLQGMLLRPWREEDAAAITPLANDMDVARNLRNVFPHPYVLADAQGYIADCIEKAELCLCLCIEVNCKPAGSIGIFPLSDVYEKSAEIGYWLGRPYWGRGIVTAAARQICAMAFDKFDLARIHAEVFASNPASCRVLEKAGFVHEGVKRSSVYKNGVLQDSHVYALVKD